MNERDIHRLLNKVRTGSLSVAQATEELRHLPFVDLHFAKVDHHRSLRQGFAEVIYARGKTTRQVVGIVRELMRPKTKQNILITRANRGTHLAVRRVNA